MNLNVVLRHELHALIKRASPDQLFVALHAQNSPIRDRFIKFLALSYADWLSTQSDIDDDNVKSQWKDALKIRPSESVFFGRQPRSKTKQRTAACWRLACPSTSIILKHDHRRLVLPLMSFPLWDGVRLPRTSNHRESFFGRVRFVSRVLTL